MVGVVKRVLSQGVTVVTVDRKDVVEMDAGMARGKNHIAPSSQHPRRILFRENEKIGKANSQCPRSFSGCVGSVGRFSAVKESDDWPVSSQ